VLENFANILDSFVIIKKKLPAFIPDYSQGFEILAYHEKMKNWIGPELVIHHSLPKSVKICG
jgi:hypothetical protein